jgi:hypothetical protein
MPEAVKISDLPGRVLPLLPRGDAELRHGYTMSDLSRLARVAERYGRGGRTTYLDTSERLEEAWSAIAAQLYSSDEKPAEELLLQVANAAIQRRTEKERSYRGISSKDGGTTMRSYARYWEQPQTPDSPGELVAEYQALRQIMPRLTPLSQRVLHALADYDDYHLAAKALGLKYPTFLASLSAARREFRKLWHQHEQPSRLWASDRRPDPQTHMRHPSRSIQRSRKKRAQAQRAKASGNVSQDLSQ